MDHRNRRLRRRLRIITARAMLCALVFSALGFTGYRASAPDVDHIENAAMPR